MLNSQKLTFLSILMPCSKNFSEPEFMNSDFLLNAFLALSGSSLFVGVDYLCVVEEGS